MPVFTRTESVTYSVGTLMQDNPLLWSRLREALSRLSTIGGNLKQIHYFTADGLTLFKVDWESGRTITNTVQLGATASASTFGVQAAVGYFTGAEFGALIPARTAMLDLVISNSVTEWLISYTY